LIQFFLTVRAQGHFGTNGTQKLSISLSYDPDDEKALCRYSVGLSTGRIVDYTCDNTVFYVELLQFDASYD
jgi:hypothetical protein